MPCYVIAEVKVTDDSWVPDYAAKVLTILLAVAALGFATVPFGIGGVEIAFADGVLTLDAGSGDEAQASESVEADVTGGDIVTGFNPQFLLDGLGAVGTAFVRLSFTQPSRPAVMSGQAEQDGDADESFRYVLMPVRFAN